MFLFLYRLNLNNNCGLFLGIKMRTAANLKFGEKVTINDIDTSNPSHQRIIEIGFTPGQEIELVNTSAFDDPLAFSVRGALIAMRRKEADCIIVT